MASDTALLTTVKSILSDDLTEEVTFQFADAFQLNAVLNEVSLPTGAAYLFVWIPGIGNMTTRTTKSGHKFADYPASFMVLGRHDQNTHDENKEDVEDLINAAYDLGIKFIAKLNGKSAIIEPNKIITPVDSARVYRATDENLYGQLFTFKVPIIISAIAC